MAELETLPVFDLTASLDGFDPVLAALLAALLEDCGIRIGTGGMALFRLEPARETTPRLALQPGETGWLEPVEGGIRLEIPPRFDGALAMVLAVLLPILCHWTGARPFPQAGTLARKVSAGLGSTSIALLAENAGRLTPLGIGEITLASWLASAGYCVLPPGIEGFAAGATLAAHRLAPLLA
jgi:molybdopterin biosynthesis enzyme